MPSCSHGTKFPGQIVDQESKQGIPYASVYLTAFQTGVICDSKGAFTLKLDLPEEVKNYVTAANLKELIKK